MIIDKKLTEINQAHINSFKHYNRCREFAEKIPALLNSRPWFCDDDGINIRIHGLKKSAALSEVDEHIWSKGIETDPPKIEYGELRIRIQGLLYLNFNLVQGDGCFQVPVGHKYVPELEWRCI